MKNISSKFMILALHLLLPCSNFKVMASQFWLDSNNSPSQRRISQNYINLADNSSNSISTFFKFTDETVVAQQSWEGGIVHKIDIDNVQADSYDLLINNLQISKKGSIEVKQNSNNYIIASIKSSNDKLEIHINSVYCRLILSTNQFGMISEEKELIICSPGKVCIKSFLKARKISMEVGEIDLEEGIDVLDNHPFILSGLTLKFKSLRLGVPFFRPFSITNLGNGYNILLSPPGKNILEAPSSFMF